MTKKPKSENSLGQLSGAKLDEMLREVQAVYEKYVEAIARSGGTIWPELKPSKIGLPELHQAALQQHLANGGNPKERPSPLAIRRAHEALEATSAHIKCQAVQALLDARWEKDVEMLLPLLSAKEQAERRITFARAVMITTGNHDRKNERPSRWIPIFQAKAAEHGNESAKWLLGSLGTDSLKKINEVRGGILNIYEKYAPDDSLSLNEFARMIAIFAYEFPRGKELIERLGGTKLHRVAVGQAKALKKIKKVLAPVSGQPKKSAPRKPKKQRT